MNKRKLTDILIAVVLALVILVILALVSFNSIKNNDKDSTISVNIYFIDNQTSSLKAEIRTIENGTNKEVLGSVLKELSQGPKNISFINTIPENVTIKEAQITDGKVIVDLSSDYNQLKAKEETYLRASIVYTLTDLSFVDLVKITCGGKDIESSTGQFVGFLSKDDIKIGNIIPPASENDQIITLYFTNDDASALIAEERQIKVDSNVPIEHYILEQLIAGPSDPNLFPTIPASTKILDITTLDNVCYLDLSNEFITKHSGGSASELYTIYSIVNSLTELQSIKKIQFLIEGVRLTDYKGHVDFSKPFERNEYLIQEVTE